MKGLPVLRCRLAIPANSLANRLSALPGLRSAAADRISRIRNLRTVPARSGLNLMAILNDDSSSQISARALPLAVPTMCCAVAPGRTSKPHPLMDARIDRSTSSKYMKIPGSKPSSERSTSVLHRETAAVTPGAPKGAPTPAQGSKRMNPRSNPS